MAYRLDVRKQIKGTYLIIQKKVLGQRKKTVKNHTSQEFGVFCMTFKNNILTQWPISKKSSAR